MTNATSATVFSEVYSAGFGRTPWLGSNLWYDPGFFDSVGARVATGPVYIADQSNQNSPGSKEFFNLAKRKFGTGLLSDPARQLYDGMIAWALGADEAGTWKWPAIRQGILAVCSSRGTPVSTYAEGYALLKQHKKIHYMGAASDCSFDHYQNVFSPFSVLHFNHDKTVHFVATMSAAQLSS